MASNTQAPDPLTDEERAEFQDVLHRLARGADLFGPLGTRITIERGPYKAEWAMGTRSDGLNGIYLHVTLGPNTVEFHYPHQANLIWCTRHQRICVVPREAK